MQLQLRSRSLKLLSRQNSEKDFLLKVLFQEEEILI
ncbi:hypothetical protein CpecG_0640 [Chlamydia pecorum MC/MarsBar]|nr:hypothetical protein CpecS_0641 [Chlamydia pecorum VR629]ETF37955.1 hypothetical protein CpecF_0641 [Chlamydia pecorum DBDeUG]ETF38223.1 hypothetical protein CpecG_0640 [Chlamydia pecorum MC/MarsBar]